MNLGLIGYGNMAQAIAKGLVCKQVLDPSCIYACAAHYDKLCNNAQALGIHAMKSAHEVIAHSDIVLLAVKPQKIEEVLLPIKEALKGKTVISIVAGYPYERYLPLLAEGTHHLSTIPNTPVAVGEGIFICENKHSLSEEELHTFQTLFSAISLVEFVDSAQFSIAGTLGGCTPAFTAMYMEALGDAGVKHGMTRESAYRIAAQMIIGTGALYLSQLLHPGALKDAICSPGGTTIKGVAALEKDGFRGAIIDAIDAIEE